MPRVLYYTKRRAARRPLRWGAGTSSLPGCNPSLALRCERCWLAPRPHPGRWLLPQVPHYVVQCPVLWIMLVRVRGSPVSVSRPRRPSAKPDDLWCHSMLLRRCALPLAMGLSARGSRFGLGQVCGAENSFCFRAKMRGQARNAASSGGAGECEAH